MTSIDPLRRSQPSRKPKRARGKKRAAETPQATNLPAIVEPAAQPAPAEPMTEAHAIFAAQLLGQEGERRGLRAGPQFIEAANASYNRAEWSGAKDRRVRQGKIAKTDV